MKLPLACLVVLISPIFADGQPPDDGYDRTYEEIIGPQKLAEIFEPTTLGMQWVEDSDELFDLLIADGRCPVGKRQDPGAPCALISYAPPNTRVDAFENALRPVFRVESASRVWTILDGSLALVDVSKLLATTDLLDSGSGPMTYVPTALIGYRENTANCERLGRDHCLDSDNFSQYLESGFLTLACKEKIWSRRVGPTGVGQHSRCRHSGGD